MQVCCNLEECRGVCGSNICVGMCMEVYVVEEDNFRYCFLGIFYCCVQIIKFLKRLL